jgi:hypothetical protein
MKPCHKDGGKPLLDGKTPFRWAPSWKRNHALYPKTIMEKRPSLGCQTKSSNSQTWWAVGSTQRQLQPDCNDKSRSKLNLRTANLGIETMFD